MDNPIEFVVRLHAASGAQVPGTDFLGNLLDVFEKEQIKDVWSVLDAPESFFVRHRLFSLHELVQEFIQNAGKQQFSDRFLDNVSREYRGAERGSGMYLGAMGGTETKSRQDRVVLTVRKPVKAVGKTGTKEEEQEEEGGRESTAKRAKKEEVEEEEEEQVEEKEELQREEEEEEQGTPMGRRNKNKKTKTEQRKSRKKSSSKKKVAETEGEESTSPAPPGFSRSPLDALLCVTRFCKTSARVYAEILQLWRSALRQPDGTLELVLVPQGLCATCRTCNFTFPPFSSTASAAEVLGTHVIKHRNYIGKDIATDSKQHQLLL